MTALVFAQSGLVMSYPMLSHGMAFVDALFEAVSGVTTTGLSTLPGVESRSDAFLFARAWMQWVGGLGVVVLALALARAAVPRQTHLRIRVAGERVTPREVELALAIICGYMMVISISWLAFLAHGAPPMLALFDVVSAVTTTGLSSGLTSAELAPALKLVLCLDMLMGRVETVALIVLLYPRTWFGMRRRST